MQVVVGRVVKPHGIRGELAVDVRTDSPEARFAEDAVLTGRTRDGTTRTLTVAAVRPHGGRLLVRFAEAGDRTAAEGLRGMTLLAEADALPPTDDPDEFYDHELEGLRAELADGTAVGTVREVVHVPAGELLAVDVSGREVLVPFVAAIVPRVDVDAGRIVLDPPEGLLDG
ncbi:ribosome maturation factor RimM [Saccharomonospora saliphila]|uniref:ribosome maturation factor RimM n=1 Tax=Saccharomonospora saliphila TaxID=369829 RepID=UPI000376D6B6|nr:ribosome maturation factor RimM [Saccharomonospora saliphila]